MKADGGRGIGTGPEKLGGARPRPTPDGKAARSPGQERELEAGIEPNLEPTRKPVSETKPEAILINEVQLLLAEKRTSLSVMRTGITVFVLPLSVLSALIATSRLYEFMAVLHLFIPLLVLCAGLVALGAYLTHRSIMKILRYDRIIEKLKKEHRVLAEFID